MHLVAFLPQLSISLDTVLFCTNEGTLKNLDQDQAIYVQV